MAKMVNLTFALLPFSKKKECIYLVGIPSIINTLDYAFIAVMYSVILP
jgi:hypothetical protein